MQKTVISSVEGYPDGLLGVPGLNGGPPRIIVPVGAQKELVMKTHRSIHHQNFKKVQYLLRPLFYWPGMDKDIEIWCDSIAADNEVLQWLVLLIIQKPSLRR